MRMFILASLFIVQAFAAYQLPSDNTKEIATSSLATVISSDTATQEILFQSTDAGLTWQNISAGLPSNKAVGCFFARDGEVIVGFEQTLYRSKSGTEVPVWEQDMLLQGRASGLFSGRGGLYVVDYMKGFSQQKSKGLWMPVFPELSKKSFRAVFESKIGAIFAGCDDGIFKSVDGGKTWKHVVQEGWMLEMVESEGVLLCTSEQGILRSTDDGDHWEVVVAEGGVGIDVAVIKGGFAEISYNTTSETRRMRISEDGGKTWKPIDTDLPAQKNISGVVEVGDFLLCGHPDGIMRSNDRGQNWFMMLPSVNGKVFNLSVSGGVVYAVARDGGC